MTTVPSVTLGELAEINPSLPLRPSAGALVSFVGMADVDARTGRTGGGHSRSYDAVASGFSQFIRNDLLVAKITPCFENGKIAIATIDREIGAGSTEFHVVRPEQGVLNPSYLLHYMRLDRVRRQGEMRMTGSAGQRRVPTAFLAGLSVPLLPLHDQRRVARVLETADALRDKRHRALESLEVLVDSLFVDMFVSNDDERWPEVLVGDLVNLTDGGIRTGPFGSQLLHSEFVDDGIAVLGIDNAVTNEFRWAQPRHITPAKYGSLKRYTVNPGDVLITMMGTCGRAAVVPDGVPTAINTKHLCCITLDQSRCLPTFLHAYFLRHPIARSYLRARAKGSVMSGLNMGIIKQLPVRLPPISLQRRFARRIERISNAKRTSMRHGHHLDELFASLQHQAFTGAL
ncbi:MAG: type restriction enzyme subunit [Gaiellaceae bacterium]|nr:type restriction enzyme subunit [Gaiellaceae bacterium]